VEEFGRHILLWPYTMDVEDKKWKDVTTVKIVVNAQEGR